MDYITPDAREEKLLMYPELFNVPIVRNGKEATVGYCPDIWGPVDVNFLHNRQISNKKV